MNGTTDELSRRPALQLVGEDDLPEYPFGAEERLTTHYFVTWHFDRWLNSEARLTMHWSLRGLALDLFFLSQKQSPIGTLPHDDRQLAALLLLDLDEWVLIRRKTPSPLYRWTPCRCGSSVRLMHPVVLEIVQDAFSHRQHRRDAAEQARVAKRLARLRDSLERMGSGRIARDAGCVERLDAWLEANCHGRRTEGQIQAALEADAQHIGAGRPP